jgi:hypothetical protein
MKQILLYLQRVLNIQNRCNMKLSLMSRMKIERNISLINKTKKSFNLQIL